MRWSLMSENTEVMTEKSADFATPNFPPAKPGILRVMEG